MDPNEEFVVVNDGSDDGYKDSVNRLRAMIDLFSKAVDTLNQSSILLRDGFQSALSVTLGSIPSDNSTTVDDLVKQLDITLKSPDDVRKNYIYQLCSKLVAVNEEKQTVMNELVTLNEQLRARATDGLDWKVIHPAFMNICNQFKEIEDDLTKNSDQNLQQSLCLGLSNEPTTDELLTFLTNISEHLGSLIAYVRSKEDEKREMVSKEVDCCTKCPSTVDKSTDAKIELVDKHDESLQTSMLKVMTSDDEILKKLVQSEVNRVLTELNLKSTVASPEFQVNSSAVETGSNSDKPNLNSSQDVNNFSQNAKCPPALVQDAELNLNVLDSSQQSVTDGNETHFRYERCKHNSVMPFFLSFVGAHIRRRLKLLNNDSNLDDTDLTAWLNSFENNCSVDPIAPQNPSFSPHEEQPWCPGCNQMFRSRIELEEHLEHCITL